MLRAEVTRLSAIVEGRPAQPADVPVSAVPGPVRAGIRVDAERVAAERVTLFRSLFVGRDDVHARRWERNGRTGWSPALDREPGQSWEEAKKARQYRPLTDAVIRDHLSGTATIGLYPMLAGDTCRLLACDFDGADWQLDAQAYAHAARSTGVPEAVEISRSGQGAHVWIFFDEPVPALDARAVGFALLREAMAVRGGLGLDSYDRFFPAQDHLPVAGEGLGNLIALPLQKERRARGTTVFVDPDTFTPHDDQWAFLARLGRLPHTEVQRLIADMRPVTVGPDTRWFRPALAHEPAPPSTIHAEWAGMLAVRRAGLPPSLLASLKHSASLVNPAFYKNENLRLSNWNTPRFIRCYVEDLEFLHLPRAMADKATDLVHDAGSRLQITDRRTDPPSIDVSFTGTLRDAQPAAVAALIPHDLGVLEAPPGSGKTVMGCALIAHHHTPTLILVDRTPLMDQWRDRLTTYLDITAEQIGQIGGGKKQAHRIHRPGHDADPGPHR
nr:DEAD/DEAH box helicase family protein [Parafrankia soli]